MNKLSGIAFILGFSFMIPARAQSAAELVDAEKSFAAYSVAHGTKAAFLHFLDSSALVFEQGKAVNGLAFWSAKNDDPGILDWRPTTTEIARSGDFGYTSGPWTFKKAAAENVLASGRFTSIWQKKNGEWKVILDLGVTGTPPAKLDTGLWIRKSVQWFEKGDLNSLIAAEKEFVQVVQKNPAEGYINYTSSTILFYRNKDSIQAGDLSILPADVKFSPIGYGMASSGDLGYVYGTALAGSKADNYLQIWRREGKNWHLVVQVLRV